MPLLFNHIIKKAYLKFVDKMWDYTANNHFYSKIQSLPQIRWMLWNHWISERFVACCTNFAVCFFVKNSDNIYWNGWPNLGMKCGFCNSHSVLFITRSKMLLVWLPYGRFPSLYAASFLETSVACHTEMRKSSCIQVDFWLKNILK